MEWRSLFSEDMKTLSLGRVAFWIALGYSTWFWFHPFGVPFPTALLEFLYATLGYNLGRAGVNAYQNVRGVAGKMLPNLDPRTQQSVVSTQSSTTQINTITQPVDDITADDISNTRKP